jgi:hypothetical protein
MGWLRAIALSKREPFPYPIAQTQKLWELTFPHEPNDALPTNVALNPNSHLPPQPPGPQAFAQPWTGKAVPIPIPPAQQPNGFIP